MRAKSVVNVGYPREIMVRKSVEPEKPEIDFEEDHFLMTLNGRCMC